MGKPNELPQSSEANHSYKGQITDHVMTNPYNANEENRSKQQCQLRSS
jgi:hypothetical protein